MVPESLSTLGEMGRGNYTWIAVLETSFILPSSSAPSVSMYSACHTPGPSKLELPHRILGLKRPTNVGHKS